mgnify:CR=1 FL=1
MRTKEGNKEKDIMEAAIKIFAENGFHYSKIAKIAEIAGVATGSIYMYYQSKEDILHKIFNSIWENLYNELLIIVNQTDLKAPEKLDSIIDLIIDEFTQNPNLALVIVNEQNNFQKNTFTEFTPYYNKFLDLAVQVIKEGIDQNYFSKNVDLFIFRFYVLGAIRNILNNWAVNPKAFPLNKIRQGIKYFTKYGLLENKQL